MRFVWDTAFSRLWKERDATLSPNCPTDHIPMTKDPKRKRTWKCPKCNLRMTKPWKGTKKYGTQIKAKFNPEWNSQLEKEIEQEGEQYL